MAVVSANLRDIDLGTAMAEVDDIVARAVQASISRGVQSTIAITDRVGNVLAVLRMTGAPRLATIPRAADGSQQDVQGVSVPAEAAAIAKAIASKP